MVDWMYLGSEPLREAFFDMDVQRKLGSPFHNIFRRQTPMDALAEWHAARPGMAPAGFIFHVSRCGSTLVCRTLDAAGGNLVLSEAFAIEAVLRAHLRVNGVTRGVQSCWLRWMVSALGQPRPGIERLFIKFDAWAIAELPVIRRAFPFTPWIFLYRDPIEVLVSHLLTPSGWALPGALHPALVNIPVQEAATLDSEDYCARALARLYQFGLSHAVRDGGLLVNYAELPEAMWVRVAPHFGLTVDDNLVERMQQCALFDSKYPRERFESDSEDKRAFAMPRQRELAESWIAPVYRQLEELRRTRMGSFDAPPA